MMALSSLWTKATIGCFRDCCTVKRKKKKKLNLLCVYVCVWVFACEGRERGRWKALANEREHPDFSGLCGYRKYLFTLKWNHLHPTALLKRSQWRADMLPTSNQTPFFYLPQPLTLFKRWNSEKIFFVIFSAPEKLWLPSHYIAQSPCSLK